MLELLLSTVIRKRALIIKCSGFKKWLLWSRVATFLGKKTIFWPLIVGPNLRSNALRTPCRKVPWPSWESSNLILVEDPYFNVRAFFGKFEANWIPWKGNEKPYKLNSQCNLIERPVICKDKQYNKWVLFAKFAKARIQVSNNFRGEKHWPRNDILRF